MGIELAIANLAFSEARSTGEAQMLVAKHRFELEQAMVEARIAKAAAAPANTGTTPVLAPAESGALYRALDQVVNEAAPAANGPARIDKTA